MRALESLKLGNNTRMQVMGKGNVKLKIHGIAQLITGVYYIPKLGNNLLSIGQLREKGLAILFMDNACKIYHPDRGLIVEIKMSSNRMFIAQTEDMTANCFKVSDNENSSLLWHNRYGHLGYKGLKLLSQKGMVKRLPRVEEPFPSTEFLESR